MMANPNVLISSDYGPIIINRYDPFIGMDIARIGYCFKDDIALIKSIIEFLLTKSDSVTYYDCGSNIGTHTLALGRTFRERIKIRAFEAQRQIFYMLCGTVALNGLSNTHVHNNAVSDSQDTIDIALPDYNAVNNFGGVEMMTPKKWSDNETMVKVSSEKVSCVTLDSFQERVDFIKLDIEGMEDRALNGAIQTIETHRPVCFIEILKTDVDFVLNFFKTRNYVAFQSNADAIFIPSELGYNLADLKKLF